MAAFGSSAIRGLYGGRQIHSYINDIEHSGHRVTCILEKAGQGVNMNCTKCKKNMTVQTDTREITIQGLQITLEWGMDTDKEMVELIKKNLGKYAPADSSTHYILNLCYECWIDSLLLRDLVRAVGITEMK